VRPHIALALASPPPYHPFKFLSPGRRPMRWAPSSPPRERRGTYLYDER